MAVSTHKTTITTTTTTSNGNTTTTLNNIINCSGCHLPFNFNNSVPKSLPCKHWFCLSCLEDMIGKSSDFAHFDCANCQQTIDIDGLNKTLEILPNSSAAANLNPNNGHNNSHLADIDTQISTRSASIASDNSIGCGLFYSNNNSNSISSNSNHSSLNPNNGHLSLLQGHQHRGAGGGSGSDNGCSSLGQNLAHMLPGENCMLHGMPNILWCASCNLSLCRGCNSGPEHQDHMIQNLQEAKESYQHRLQQDIGKLQGSLGDMEHLQRIQREFLLGLLESCCTLKTHLEQELQNQSHGQAMDGMRETVKMLQLHMDLMPECSPQDYQKLSQAVAEEKQRFYLKHKEMLRQYQISELIASNERLLDFSSMQQIFQKQDLRSSPATGAGDGIQMPSNPMLHLTNYCVFHLYLRYSKQKQQFFENQLWRYQQYQQQIIANFKTHQQNQKSATPLGGTASSNSTSTSNSSSSASSGIGSYHQNGSPTNYQGTGGGGGGGGGISSYDQLQIKRKTYAEIASSQKSFDSHHTQDSFDLFTGPLTVSQYKQLEEVGKCIDLLLLNPISNDNNHIYYFDFERGGEFLGRVLIKVYASYAPKMAYNFHALCSHEKGVGYRGCKVFKCYPNQSIITGDIDQNNGYGSRSIYDEAQFVPDDTKIPPFIGAVGMRRAKKIYDSQCLVGSQFRIILKVRPFSAIFGRVIEGLEVVWNISQAQVQNSDKQNALGSAAAGMGHISVAQCGVYEFAKRNLQGGI
ncbi:uncharacterized protein LOC131802750 [Musca domestica]|uniref:Uncharacterized protein LOC131802750 n=1 Tax=Musca domestica TaxID=7370 RepID=A0ABM3V0E5_MUSDO|nr:uncharacterized protein LOC131802750 [Musca domestica]